MAKPDPKSPRSPANGTGGIPSAGKTAKATAAHVTKMVGDMFNKVGEKTGMSNKKVDAFQKKYLDVPKNRTKYEGLKDAPKVAGEEMFAMFNDIIDFAQREGGGQSHVFKKMKDEGGEFIKNPAVYAQKKAEKGKKKTANAKKASGKGAKGGVMAGGLGGLVEKAKSGMAAAKERAGKGMAEAKKRAEEVKKMAESKAADTKKATKKGKK